jgi:Cu+-exporting ATPase
VVLGNSRLIEEERLRTTQLDAAADELRQQGQTVMFVAAEGAVIGLIGVADPIKETTAEAIEQLHEQGFASSC